MPPLPVEQLVPPLTEVVCTLPTTRPRSGLTLSVIGGPELGALSGAALTASARLGVADGQPALRVAVRGGGAWVTGEARPAAQAALEIARPMTTGPVYLGAGATLRTVALTPGGARVRPNTDDGLQPVDDLAFTVACADLRLASHHPHSEAAALPKAAGATVSTSRLVYGPLTLRDAKGGRVIATGAAQWWGVWDVAPGDGGADVVIPHWTKLAWRGWLDSGSTNPPRSGSTFGGSVTEREEPTGARVCDHDVALHWQVGDQRWLVGGIDAGAPFYLWQSGSRWRVELPEIDVTPTGDGSWWIDPANAGCPTVAP